MFRPSRRTWSSITVRMASSTTRQPAWVHPQGTSIQPQLKVYNTLTRSKVPFVPIEHDKVTWYSCGPTVYDDAHLGHARNYVTIDILRRIMRDYFKFKVRFVMNITDVDDKIILRGRQRYFFEGYKQKHRYIDEEVIGDVLRAWLIYIEDNLPRIPLEQKISPGSIEATIQHFYGDILAGGPLEPGNKPGDNEAKVKMHINTVKSAAQALNADMKTLTPTAFYAMVNDVMCTMLDKKFGSTIKGDDYAIFTELTQEYEQRFFQDMRDLNVLDPDELVRVTESGEDIAQFVDKIVENKFGYAANDGSVYFDIQAFESAGNPYARLEPWNRGDKSLQADGEGALSKKGKSDKRLDYKRGPGDFALWKLSRPGEPAWPSPWGPGRPGWHIECSAMASAKLGRQMDIHSGGIDLAFPHHDNELAQSEAYWSTGSPNQWVNYFFHMGHLSIQGSKMSKSLKNFTTIRAALDREGWTSRGLRIVFLLGSWRDGIEITDDLVKESTAWEDRVDNFFINSIEALKSVSQDSRPPILAEEVAKAQTIVQESLLDSFNTQGVMNVISQLINKYNGSSKADLSFADHQSAAQFVTQLVNMLGLNGNATVDSQQLGWQGIEIPDSAKEYVYPLAKMRDELRQAAVAKSITADKIKEIISTAPHVEEPVQSSRPRPSYARALTDFRSTAETTASAGEAEINKQILALCDKVRDVDLWNLDIYLEDRDNLPALVRPVTQGLRAARREKEEKALQKEEARRKREQEAREKLEKGRTPPSEMFRPPHTDEFGGWDGDGLPTTDKEGNPLPASRIKKLRKDWERQKKAHDNFLAAVTNGTLSLQSSQ